MNQDSRALSEELAGAVERRDVDRIGELVEANLWALVQGHWPLLMTSLQQLPAEFFEANPTVALVKRFGTSVFLEGGGVNERAMTVPAGEDAATMPDGLVDAMLLQEMLAHRLRGEFSRATEIAERLRTRVERADDQGRRPIHDMVAFYLLHVGITEALAGNLDQALRDMGNVRSLRPKAGYELGEYDAGLKRAVMQAALGRLGEAERLLRRSGEPPELSDPFASQLAATETAARALIAVDRLSPDAPELVRLALEQNADAEMWPFALLASTRWSIATGDLVGVLDQVDEAAATRPAPSDSLLGRVIVLARAQSLALLGEFGDALRALDGLADDGEEQPNAAVIRIRIAFYMEGPEAALMAARRLVVRAGIGPSARAETMLLAAWAQTMILGVPDGATAGPLGALVAREGLWRMLQLVPDRVAEAIPGLEAAPRPERRLLLRDPSDGVRLTANELEIVQLLAGSESLAAIAKRRFVSQNTIKTQVQSIYRRLGVHGRREAVVEATRRGLLRRRRG